MTAAQEARARHNLDRLMRRIDDWDGAVASSTDATYPPPFHSAPFDVWDAHRKIPLIRARLWDAGLTP